MTPAWLLLPLSARGLCWELARVAGPVGTIPVSGGSARAFARLLGAHESEVRRLSKDVGDLIEAEVFTVSADGAELSWDLPEELSGIRVEASRVMTNAERQAAYRARRKRNGAVTDSVTEAVTDPVTDGRNAAPSPSQTLPLPDISQIRPPLIPPAAEKPRKRATQMPEGWAPNPAVADWAARELGITRPDFDGHLAHFIDRSLAKGERFVDWNLALKNWLRNAKKWARPTPQTRVGTLIQPPAKSNEYDWRQDLGGQT